MSNETVDGKIPFDTEETGQPTTDKARHFGNQTKPNDDNERSPINGGTDGQDTQDSASGDPDSSDSGPKNKKPLIWAAVGCAIALLVVAIALSQTCRHEEWIPATCSEPKTCAECGATEGKPLGHEWVEATCTEPKTCSRCGETEGEPLGHIAGDWEDSGIDFSSATRSRVRRCSRCGDVVESESSDVTSFMEGGVFMFSPFAFSNRLDGVISDIDYSYGAATGTLGESAAVAITKNGDQVAGILFLDSSENTLDSSEKYSENSFAKMMVVFTNEETEVMAYSALALVQTCDPALSFEEARQAALELTESFGSGGVAAGVADRNGIHYALAYLEGSWAMTVTPSE